MQEVFLVTQCLPEEGEEVMAYGNSTFCCASDMQPQKAWHKCTFNLIIEAYKLKKQVPEDPEMTILEKVQVVELWDVDKYHHIIGVTCWKKIPKTH